MVANLPYNITTDFLKATLPLGHAISDLHIMLQVRAGGPPQSGREDRAAPLAPPLLLLCSVAELWWRGARVRACGRAQDEAGKRLVHSGPGDADYRAMSVRVALYSKPKYRCACLRPRPSHAAQCAPGQLQRERHVHHASPRAFALASSTPPHGRPGCCAATHSDIPLRFSIPKEKYYPAPGVDGALITFTLTPHAPRRLALPSDRGFLATVDKGFGERRKKLRNSLQPLFAAEQVRPPGPGHMLDDREATVANVARQWTRGKTPALPSCCVEQVEAGLVQLGLQPTARAQDLSVAQWAALYNLLHQLQLELHEARRDVVEQA